MAGGEVKNGSNDTSDEHMIENKALKERGLLQHCEWRFSAGSMDGMMILPGEKQRLVIWYRGGEREIISRKVGSAFRRFIMRGRGACTFE